MRKLVAMILALTMSLGVGVVLSEQKELTVAALVHVENQWGAMLAAGYQAAAKEQGVNLLLSNYNNDTAKMIELLDTYHSMGVDAIMTNPNDSSTALLNNYAAGGMHIGTTNLHFPALDKTTVALAYSQQELGGASVETALDIIKNKLNGEVHLGVISVRSGSVASDARDAGFVDGIRAVYPEVTIENQAYTMVNDEGLRFATDMLTANPKLNIIFGGCEAGVVGAVQAIRNLGLESKVFVFGVDASEQMCRMLMDEDEVLWAIGAQNSYEMGYNAMTKLINRIRGAETFEPGAKEFIQAMGLKRGDFEEINAYIDMLKSFQN